jgi:hypothetical protein
MYQITPRSIDELVPYARNARTHIYKDLNNGRTG